MPRASQQYCSRNGERVLQDLDQKLGLADTSSGLIPALLDINMLALLSGMERIETQWRLLLGSVGLEIVKF